MKMKQKINMNHLHKHLLLNFKLIKKLNNIFKNYKLRIVFRMKRLRKRYFLILNIKMLFINNLNLYIILEMLNL